MPRRGDRPRVKLRVVVRGLMPASAFDEELLSRYAQGSVVEADIHQKASGKQLRLLWWALGKIVPNQDIYPNAEALMEALKIDLGYVETITLIGGGLHVNPRSLSTFQSDELSQFIDKALDRCAEEVIPGLDITVLLREGRIAVGGDE